MPTLQIESFTGMDRRRKRVAGVPGSLWDLKNAHLTRGGDIQRSKRFVSKYALPAGSVSLAALRSQLFTFGSADLAATTPLGVQYQRLQSGHASATLTIASGQNAADTETVTIGARTYTFQTILTNTDGNVLIGASRTATLTNLCNAINLGSGSGTTYAAATTLHSTAFARDNADGTATFTAKADGTGGNALASTETMGQGSFGGTTFTGGGGATMTRILDAKAFQGALYVIAEYNDGHIRHFYDGTRVSDWDLAVAAVGVTTNDVAERLAVLLNRDEDVSAAVFGATVQITAREAGTAYTIAAATSNVGVDTTQAATATSQQANVAGVAETLATADIEITAGSNEPGTNTITSITVDGVEILSAVVDWAGTNAATAIRVATEINNGSALHGYTAAVASATVTITAAVGTGDSLNGDVVDVTTTGDVTVTADATVSGGVDAVTAVAQVYKVVISGTVESGDVFTVTINGTAYKCTGLSAGMGTSVYVDKQHLWSTAGRLWRFCMLGNATVWDPANGTPDNDAGFIDLSETTEATDNFVAATRYQNQAAVFSPGFIVLYALDVDPTLVAVTDTLDNTGTDVPKAIVRYGNNDVFYLDNTGIRSLRARDASNAPFVSDVGNAVDTFVTETMEALTPAQIADAVANIEPRDGRFWLAAGGYIFVLSYFPADKISGWSYYQPDEFDDDAVSALVRAGKKMFVRAGDTVFLYGGDDGTTYPDDDESTVSVKMPFLSAGALAQWKAWTGFDIACTNEWAIVFAYDPNDEDKTIEIGRITKVTFDEMNTNLAGESSMVALELTCSKGGEATISSVAMHYEKI